MHLTEIPFFFKYHDTRGNGGYPEVFPFHLYFDDALKMYRQRPTPELEKLLDEVYRSGSLVEGSLSAESGRIYLERTVAFLEETTALEGKKIFEIGCGSGTLLKEIRSRGAHALGLEPGRHQTIQAIEDITIIRDFFPSQHVQGPFDIVIHFGVMEHVADPFNFLLQQKALLVPRGKIFLAVPNCEPFLETGDISIFIHEHYSYFTRESLNIIAQKAGLTVEHCRVIEGMLHAILSEPGQGQGVAPAEYKFERDVFEKKVDRLNHALSQLFSTFDESDIGIYVPLRALNAAFTTGKRHFRLIDDNSQMRNKYLPLFSNPVESFSEMIANPPACILIYSRTFGERIRAKCVAIPELKSTKILTLNDLDHAE